MEFAWSIWSKLPHQLLSSIQWSTPRRFLEYRGWIYLQGYVFAPQLYHSVMNTNFLRSGGFMVGGSGGLSVYRVSFVWQLFEDGIQWYLRESVVQNRKSYFRRNHPTCEVAQFSMVHAPPPWRRLPLNFIFILGRRNHAFTACRSTTRPCQRHLQKSPSALHTPGPIVRLPCFSIIPSSKTIFAIQIVGL